MLLLRDNTGVWMRVFPVRLSNAVLSWYHAVGWIFVGGVDG